MIERLIKNFKATSFKHLIIIFSIFAISGSLTLIISEPIINILKMIDIVDGNIILITLRIIIILPLYQIILIAVAYLFGEFKYFYNFEKEMYKKLFKKFK